METLLSQLAANEAARRGLTTELEGMRARERELELRVLTAQDDKRALVDQVGETGRRGCMWRGVYCGWGHV
jgi:hypothetical protein